MDSKQCEKCGETVDAAKAFCPACGNPFVAEQERTRVSEFDASAGTVQFGNTVYNKLLSDMGLNISELKQTPPKPAAEIRPEPATPPTAMLPERPPRNRMLIWIAVFGVIFLIGAAVVVLAAALLVYLRWSGQFSF